MTFIQTDSGASSRSRFDSDAANPDCLNHSY